MTVSWPVNMTTCVCDAARRKFVRTIGRASRRGVTFDAIRIRYRESVLSLRLNQLILRAPNGVSHPGAALAQRFWIPFGRVACCLMFKLGVYLRSYQNYNR